LTVGIAGTWGRVGEWLDAVRIEGEVVEVGELLERIDQLRMLVGDVLLDKVGRFEQLQASLASEFALVLLLDMRLHCFR
jgi:hypothetical protein